MNPNELIEYIVENDKTEMILESIGCFGIRSYGKEYRCGCDKYSNTTSIRVKKETLKIRVFSSADLYGNIFTLIMDLLDIGFYGALKHTHEILGIKFTNTYKKDEVKKRDPLEIFKKAAGKKSEDNVEVNILNEDIFDEYIQMPYIEWVREGILPHTQDVFAIGYSGKYNRVVIPHRYWCGKDNEFVGVMGRTLNENYKLLDIPKYFPLHNFPKTMNVYGLQENYNGIQAAGYVVLYEAEKSVMKRHSRRDYTGVAMSSHNISDEQLKILIGLDVDIVIAFDKDIPLITILKECDRFYGIRRVSYIWDDLDILKDKESPADLHDRAFKILFNRRIEYDGEQRKKLMKMMEEEE